MSTGWTRGGRRLRARPLRARPLRALRLPACGLLTVLALLWHPVAAGAGEHVRVVLDVSKSMRQTDPGGLARLSTVLLYDLASPDLALDDSFEVLPFHPTQKWHSPQDPPPRGIGQRLRPRLDARAAFARQVRGLGYDADWTYFYPGLLAAIEDLERTPRRSDVRVVVIVTDGLPETPTRREEARLIRQQLQPRMVKARIWLYVLAFGAKAAAERTFFDDLVRTGSGQKLGEVFIDPAGDRLPGHMLELFSHAFGYTQDPPRPVVAEVPVDLEGAATPARAVAVVYTPEPSPPTLDLAAPAPAPRPPTSPDGVEKASDVAASYALQWVLSPHPGDHRLRTNAAAGTVAVLRPTRLRLEVRPPAGGQALRTMAKTPMPLEVLVKPPGGVSGDPGEVQISFTASGPRTGVDPATGASLYAWRGREGAPPPGPSALEPAGRVYPIEAIFEREPDPEQPFYAGYLELEARRGAALVGALDGDAAHRIEVFPRVRIVPSPGLGDAVTRDGAPRALEQGERACGLFRFELDVGRLPHPDRPRYPVRALIDSAVRLEGPLHRARFTLDGLPLEVAGARQGGARPAEKWSKGRVLERGDLLGEHEMCIELGRPAQKTEVTVRVPLAVTLLESPYDDFRVVEPFVFKVQVARPGVLERWRSLLLLALFLLGALLALWYLRDRPELPDDLRVALGRAAGEAPASVPLADGPPWAPWLGLSARRPVTAPGESRVLGWIRPDRRELYSFEPASGVRMHAAESIAASADRAGAGPSTGVEAGRRYRLESDEGEIVLRVEYGS